MAMPTFNCTYEAKTLSTCIFRGWPINREHFRLYGNAKTTAKAFSVKQVVQKTGKENFGFAFLLASSALLEDYMVHTILRPSNDCPAIGHALSLD